MKKNESHRERTADTLLVFFEQNNFSKSQFVFICTAIKTSRFSKSSFHSLFKLAMPEIDLNPFLKLKFISTQKHKRVV